MNTMNSSTEKKYEKNIGSLQIYECYKKSPFLSYKHSSYFQVYAELLEQYRNKPITFVEIGVANGGSLFMWREYFGESARIIGIDNNPQAKKWEEHGFEIYIGSQTDTLFLDELFQKVGDVDVVLDDGGHTYEQQIVTAYVSIPHIKDGGLLIVEDTHTSYMKEFGYPSKYTFVEWTKTLIDCINERFPLVKKSTLPYNASIYSISIYASIVSFKIHREKCFESTMTTNDGVSVNAECFRYKGSAISRIYSVSESVFRNIKKYFPIAGKIHFLIEFKNILMDRIIYIYSKLTLRKLKKYF